MLDQVVYVAAVSVLGVFEQGKAIYEENEEKKLCIATFSGSDIRRFKMQLKTLSKLNILYILHVLFYLFLDRFQFV